MMRPLFLFGLLGSLVFSQSALFGNYWYTGVAELSSYELSQFRYEDNHPGTEVLIFVTEDFFNGSQVKYEFGKKENTTSILKLNRMKEFNTGVYSYRMMTSVFQPVTELLPLKLTHSSQDWCGQTFSQINSDEETYRFKQYSYFQAEGDREATFDKIWLEDGIWVQIRLNPNQLPQGEIQLISSLNYQRFSHQKQSIQKAIATKQNNVLSELIGKRVTTYQLVFVDTDRTFTWYIQSEFPHRIEGWEERQMVRGKEKKSTGKRINTILLDYWGKHGLSDHTYRKLLGL